MSTWFGGTGFYGAPKNWSPTGVPQDGFIISTGTMFINNRTLDGPIQLQGTDAVSEPVLDMRNVTLTASHTFTDPGGPGEGPRYYGEVNVFGHVTNEGTIDQGGASAARSGP